MLNAPCHPADRPFGGHAVADPGADAPQSHAEPGAQQPHRGAQGGGLGEGPKHQDETHQKPEDGRGLGHGLTHQHGRGHGGGCFRLTGNPFAAGPGGHATAVAGADCGQAGAEPGTDQGGRGGPVRRTGGRFEQQDQRHHHGEDGRCLANGRADKHVGGDASGDGGLAGDRQTGAPGRNAGPHAGTDGPETHAEARSQKGGGFDHARVGDIHEQQEDGDDQGKDGGRLGDGLTHQHVFDDIAGVVAVAGNGLGGFAGGKAFAGGGADGTEAHGNGPADIGRGVGQGQVVYGQKGHFSCTEM